MLGLLLPPPRSLCASTGHSPHRPLLGAGVARHGQGPMIRGQLPWENARRTSGWCNVTLASAAAGSPRLLRTAPSPGLSEPEPPKQLLL